MWPSSEVPCDQLIRAANKLGLTLKQGRKHTIVCQISSGRQTQIPRHPRVKRETARGIIEFFIVQMAIPEEDVAKALGVEPPLLSDKRRGCLEGQAA